MAKTQMDRTKPSTMDQLIEIRSVIQRLANRNIARKARAKKLAEDLGKDLHIIAIETEGLIAVGLKKPRPDRRVRANEIRAPKVTI